MRKSSIFEINLYILLDIFLCFIDLCKIKVYYIFRYGKFVLLFKVVIEMKNAKKILTSNAFWIILFLVLSILSVLIIFIIRSAKTVGKTASIYSKNRLVRTVSLDNDDKFTIKNGDSYNIIRIKDGKISVVESDCKNQICVHQGEIDSSLLPIVCVPNGLVIRVRDGEQDIDAVT